MAQISIAGDTSGSITLQAPAIAGTTTLTLPATSGTIVTGTTPSGTIVGTTDTQTLTNKTLGAGTVMPTGSILQVVSTTKTDFFSTASSSYVDVTGLSASITPSSSSNKILVTITGFCGSSGSANGFAYGVVLRNSTQIGIGDARGSAQQCSVDLSLGNLPNAAIQEFAKPFSITLLDSPATTSSTTYKLQVKATVASVGIGGSWSTVDANRSNTPTIITLMEIKG